MKTLKKLLIRVVLVVVALLVILFLARNFIARKAVEVGVTKVTGFPLEIGSVNVDLFGGKLEVKNLKLTNPPEFHGGVFVDMPNLKVNYRTLSMLSSTPHINEIVVNVEQLLLVKDEKGESNANALQAKVSPPAKATPEGTEKPTEEKKAKYQVDVVRAHVGTIIKRKYVNGLPSDVKITLDRDIEIKNVTESSSITALVMKAILGPVGEVAGDLVKGVGGAVKGAGDAVQKAGKGLFDMFNKSAPKK